MLVVISLLLKPEACRIQWCPSIYLTAQCALPWHSPEDPCYPTYLPWQASLQSSSFPAIPYRHLQKGLLLLKCDSCPGEEKRSPHKPAHLKFQPTVLIDGCTRSKSSLLVHVQLWQEANYRQLVWMEVSPTNKSLLVGCAVSKPCPLVHPQLWQRDQFVDDYSVYWSHPRKWWWPCTSLSNVKELNLGQCTHNRKIG